MKQIVHIPNASTAGHALETFEARARQALDLGYGVAPIPTDGQEHPESVRGFQACPACSTTENEAGREVYAQEQQRRQVQALREALDSPKASGEGLGAEWASPHTVYVHGPIQGRTARVIVGTHSFAVELSAGGELVRVETHRGATRPESPNMAGVISALRGWLDPKPIGKPLELDPIELRYLAEEGLAAARATLESSDNQPGEDHKDNSGGWARENERRWSGQLAALDAGMPTCVQRNAYLTSPAGVRYRIWDVSAEEITAYDHTSHAPVRVTLIRPPGSFWSDFFDGWRPTTTADIPSGEPGWTPEEMGAPLES